MPKIRLQNNFKVNKKQAKSIASKIFKDTGRQKIDCKFGDVRSKIPIKKAKNSVNKNTPL